MFKLKFFALVFTVMVSSIAHADLGVSAGVGLPFTSMFAVNYTAGKKFTIDLSYNSFSIAVGGASVSLTKPELNLKFHPFEGSFFLGVGIGQFTMSAKGTDADTGQTATVSVTSLALTPNLGWMWGVANGGFWMGLDVGYQMPQSPTTTIESALPTSSQQYRDAVDAANTYGSTSLLTMSFLRLGWLF